MPDVYEAHQGLIYILKYYSISYTIEDSSIRLDNHGWLYNQDWSSFASADCGCSSLYERFLYIIGTHYD